MGVGLDNYRSQRGHIVVRVYPGGSRYEVWVLDDSRYSKQNSHPARQLRRVGMVSDDRYFNGIVRYQNPACQSANNFIYIPDGSIAFHCVSILPLTSTQGSDSLLLTLAPIKAGVCCHSHKHHGTLMTEAGISLTPFFR